MHFQLFDAARRLDEYSVSPGANVAFGAAHGFVEIVNRSGVGARQNPGFGFEALGTGRPDFCLGQFDRHHFFADHMTAALRPLLILDQDRAHAHAFVTLHRVHHVLDVAVAVVAVDEHRQVAGRHDVAHAGRDFAKTLEPDVGDSIARADRRETADEIRLEADFLYKTRAERVMRAGNNEKSLVPDRRVDDLSKTCRH